MSVDGVCDSCSDESSEAGQSYGEDSDVHTLLLGSEGIGSLITAPRDFKTKVSGKYLLKKF